MDARRLANTPSSNGHGRRRRELSYDTAHAMQNWVLRAVKLGEEQLFCPSATQFWTPHSIRTFMPSATAVLGFEKSVRYASIEAQRIMSMQRTAVAELQKVERSTACSETLAQLDGFLSEQGEPKEARSRFSKSQERGVRTEVPRASEELTRQK